MSISASHLRLLALGGGIALLTGCSVGPDYVQPAVPQAVRLQGIGSVEKGPSRATTSPRETGTTVFHDPKLNELESEATVESQTLRAAIARVTESRASARQTEAAFFPSVNFDADGSRQRHLAQQRPAGCRRGWSVRPYTSLPRQLSHSTSAMKSISGARFAAPSRLPATPRRRPWPITRTCC